MEGEILNLEILKILLPTIDWDKCCDNYRKCFECPIGEMTKGWECDLINIRFLPFKEAPEMVIEAIQEFSNKES